MKKLLLGAILCGGMLFADISAQAAVFSTNITSTINGVFLLFTNRASVYNVELTGTTPALVEFFDTDTLVLPLYGTNYTNPAWVSRTIYPTNFVTSFVGNNGYTNWYTNAGTWILNITNAASTNNLPSLMSFVTAGNTYAVYNTDALFARGVTVRVSTNVTLTINYRSAQ